VDPGLPETFRDGLGNPVGWDQISSADLARTRLSPGDQRVVSRWVYALAAPFPTLVEDIPFQELQKVWRGKTTAVFQNSPLLMTESTRTMLTALWGEPAPERVKVVSKTQLQERAWNTQPSWAVVAFDQLNPRWKVLALDGLSPLAEDFDIESYPLVVPISLTGEHPEGITYPETNRDPDRMTSLVMTGVTALVRATAYTMEQQGLTYPARDIKGVLRSADFTHISNEVPFVHGCPYPNPSQVGLVFCSDPRYIELLEFVGTDLVELTGDHFGDWGPQAMLDTLVLYQERGWPYYGGGANLSEARQPVRIKHNGNWIAFVGCNAKGGGYATAASGYPGAAACNFDILTSQIRSLRQEGYLVIATFQHFEYYTYQAQPPQIRDARRVAEAGAVIVQGSQAHQPQALEFTQGAFIHHGLGNLFFDQIYEIPPNTATAFIDRHIFYQGKHLSTELIPIRFVDFARSRLMGPGERQELLDKVFQASGW
jgi:poly-gamma-glutamate synthesis protein (capsule biosynthesis protein)